MGYPAQHPIPSQMSPPAFGHPMHFANAGNPQEFHHGPPQGNYMPPIFPSGIPQPQYMRQYQPHPGYPQPISMMPNPYGLPAYGGPAAPASVPNQQVPLASLGPPPTLALQPQPAPKNRPNREVRPGGNDHSQSFEKLTSFMLCSVRFSD